MDNFPRCRRCTITRASGYRDRRRVDEVHEMERSHSSVTWLAKCHGEEHTLRVDFGHAIDDEEVSIAARALRFFDSELSR